MSIRHVYERVVALSKLPPHDYQIKLEDGTIVNLPGTGWVNFKEIKEGDRLLIDFEGEHLPTAAMVNVFRDFQSITSFGVNKDYIETSVPA